jgi:muramoyltetrapeptide carboxypeptidase
MRYSQEQKSELRDVLLARTQNYAFPIIADMDFGHTSPQFILPIGCLAKFDSHEKRFDILEGAVV